MVLKLLVGTLVKIKILPFWVGFLFKSIADFGSQYHGIHIFTVFCGISHKQIYR